MDIANHHHLIVGLPSHGCEKLFRIHRNPRENLTVHLGHALGRADKPRPVRIFTDSFYDETDALFDFFNIHGV